MLAKIHEAVILLFMVAAFVLGRMSVPTPQQTEVKNDHTVTEIVTIRQPNGEVKTTKKIDSTIKSTEKSTVPALSNKSQKLTNLSLLAGYDFSSPRHLVPVYGLGVTREVLAPVTLGAYGLTNGIVGLSIGVNF